MLDLRRGMMDSPSTTAYYELEFDGDGVAQLGVEPGDYDLLLLQHEDFFVVPSYFFGLRIGAGCNDDLPFRVGRKVMVRGRVIDAGGTAVRDAEVMGELGTGIRGGSPADPWSFAGWATSDGAGIFQIALAAGPARVSFGGISQNGEQRNLIADAEYVEFNVPADGSAAVRDILVRPLPTFTGVVKNPDSSPAPGAVVRFAGRFQPSGRDVLWPERGISILHEGPSRRM